MQRVWGILFGTLELLATKSRVWRDTGFGDVVYNYKDSPTPTPKPSQAKAPRYYYSTQRPTFWIELNAIILMSLAPSHLDVDNGPERKSDFRTAHVTDPGALSFTLTDGCVPLSYPSVITNKSPPVLPCLVMSNGGESMRSGTNAQNVAKSFKGIRLFAYKSLPYDFFISYLHLDVTSESRDTNKRSPLSGFSS